MIKENVLLKFQLIYIIYIRRHEMKNRNEMKMSLFLCDLQVPS